MNLTTKVLLTLALSLAVALAAAGFFVRQGAERATLGYFTETTQQQAEALAAEAGALYADGFSWAQIQAWLDGQVGPGMGGAMGRGPVQGQGRNSGRNGHMGTRSFLLVDPATGAPLAAGDGAGSTPLDAAAVDVAVPVAAGGATVALLAPARLPANLSTNEQALLARINSAILLSALAAGLVALVAGSVLVASILRPLRRLEQAVAQVAEGNLDVTVATTGRGEIGQLAANFNRMAGNLRRQEELRQRLVADIAHELRTPLSVVQGNLQAILDGVYPLEAREIRIIYDETRLLARLVNDLHELAQAEAQRLPLLLQRIDAAAALASTAESFRTLAEEKGVTLAVAAPAPGLEAEADPDRLLQIMHNLVGNALRHTPPGGEVALGAAGDGTGNLVRFQVRNSGAGIAPADLPHVFDRFYRTEASRSREPGDDAGYPAGTGLGLAIVKALAEAHGGAVGVESAADGADSGSTFWFTLPRA